MQSIEGAIGGNSYQHNKVNQWTSNVVEQCLNQLTKLGKPFKYIGKNKLLDYTWMQFVFSLNSMGSIKLLFQFYNDNISIETRNPTLQVVNRAEALFF